MAQQKKTQTDFTKVLEIGRLEKPIEIPGGRLIFLSKSRPFTAQGMVGHIDGEILIRTAQARSQKRQDKKLMMASLNVSGKGLKRIAHLHKLKGVIQTTVSKEDHDIHMKMFKSLNDKAIKDENYPEEQVK